MKILKKYLLPLLIILAIIILAIFSHKNSKPISRNHVSNNNATKVCYLYEQKSDVHDDSVETQNVPTPYDREYIELGFNDDLTVTGIHQILPAQRDSNRANIIGVSDGTFVNVIATAHAEGETWQEQRLYKIENDQLYVGYQPIYVPQYKNENDIYMYEDLSKLIFDTDTFFLNKIECSEAIRSNIL